MQHNCVAIAGLANLIVFAKFYYYYYQIHTLDAKKIKDWLAP